MTSSILNQSIKVEAIVTSLSKALDTLNRNLFLCKLKAYGLDTNALTLIQSHFSNIRKEQN